MKTALLVSAKFSTPGDSAVTDAGLMLLQSRGFVCLNVPTDKPDCVVLGGGGTLYERHAHVNRTFEDRPHSLITEILTKALNFGSVLLTLGCGCQGFECDDDVKNVWRGIVSRSQNISIRDSGSGQWLHEDLGVHEKDPRISISGDLAFSIPWEPQRQYRNPKRIVVSITPSGMASSMESLKTFLREKTNEGFETVWFPFAEEDVEPLKTCCNELKGKFISPVFHEHYFPDYVRYLSLLNTAALSISTRLHGSIFSIMAACPVVSIVTSRKSELQLRHLFPNPPEWELPAAFETVRLHRASEFALHNSTEISLMFRGIREREKNRVLENADKVFSI